MFHSSAKDSKSLRALLAIFMDSVSLGTIVFWLLIRPAVEVRSLVSEPVASMIDFRTLGTSKPSVAASISAAVRYLVFCLVGVLAAPPTPDSRFFLSSFRLFFSSSSESSRTSPRKAASLFSSSFACFVFSRTAPKPAPVGRSWVSTGASLPRPEAPRPCPST